ncbi:MAG TPA: ABC transporter permease, partial [Bryobacteraceae bacterium]|nr:ABC transporter permease [Bryobacteraceae bacterium]
MKDLKVTLRQLQKSPGFAVTAVLTMALGIGATTAMFTLLYDVLLKPLPFEHPDQLVTIQEKVAEWSNIYLTWPVSANHFAFWQRHDRAFKAMAVMQQYSTPLGLGERPLQVGILSATPGLFQVLQVEPGIGRPFANAEAQPGHEHVDTRDRRVLYAGQIFELFQHLPVELRAMLPIRIPARHKARGDHECLRARVPAALRRWQTVCRFLVQPAK